MRNRRKYFVVCLLLIFALSMTVFSPAQAASKKASSKKEKIVGWYTKKGKTYYYLQNGKKNTGWLELDGKKYYFNKSGVMQKGFKTVSKKTYYFAKTGEMRTGWQTVSKKKYYLGTDGVRVSGWQTIDGNRYYFNKKGVMQKGWVTYKKKKYYLNSAGVMQTGFQTISKKKYYFDANGVMLKGQQIIEEEEYYFNTKGVMQTGWVKIKGKYYFYDKKTGILDPTQKKNMTELEKKCDSLLGKIVKSSDSDTTKIKKIFDYVTWKYSYYRTYDFKATKGWSKKKALDMINSKKGNCYSYAATFGYLVKKATGLSVRIYYGSTPGSSVPWTPHGWCEVKLGGSWRVFDPDLYRFVYNQSAQFYDQPRSSVYYKVGGYETAEF